MSTRTIGQLSVTVAPRGKHVILNVHYGNSDGISESVTLSGDDAADLAAWLLMMAGLVGTEQTQISDLATKLRDRFADLARAVRILTPDEHADIENACPFCGRVIHHPTNRERHLAWHMKQEALGLPTFPGEQ